MRSLLNLLDHADEIIAGIVNYFRVSENLKQIRAIRVYAKYYEIEFVWKPTNGQRRSMGRSLVAHNDELARHVEVTIIKYSDGTWGKSGKLFIDMPDTYHGNHFSSPEQRGQAEVWRGREDATVSDSATKAL